MIKKPQISHLQPHVLFPMARTGVWLGFHNRFINAVSYAADLSF